MALRHSIGQRQSRKFSPARNLLGLLICFVLLTGSAYARDSSNPLYTISSIQNGKSTQWTVDLASTAETRSRGLMFVKNLPPQSGMLFRFEETRLVSMWMKNTFISLDMIFLTESGRISTIRANTTPHSLDNITSGDPVRFVLEINAGEAGKAGLKTGQLMRHPWFANAGAGSN